ncbi:MAG: hypothetical protein WC435_03375 [Candidatus Paceibacterota bacterium]
MQIIPFSNTEEKKWNSFCLQSNDAWFWHTSDWINFIFKYQLDSEAKNFSFSIQKNGKILAVIPLILEIKKSENDLINGFYFSSWATPMPALSNNILSSDKEKIYQIILEEIEKLSRENNVSVSRFVLSSLSLSFLNKKYSTADKMFSFFSYNNVNASSQIIDLSKSLNELKRNLRHGHRADITRGEKILTTSVFDSSNITSEIFNQYTLLYKKRFGVSNRPSSTFDIMFKLIKDSKNFIVFAFLDKIPVGVSYFYTFKDNAFYGSACNDPNINNIPTSHVIQWSAIKYMKNKKMKFYEIGHQPYWSPTDKQLNISHFKKGFGGLIVPMFMKEKKYNYE